MKNLIKRLHLIEIMEQGNPIHAEIVEGIRVLEERQRHVEAGTQAIYDTLFGDKKSADPTKVVELRQTCFGCPSQWEGSTEDGRYVYIRYRWGNLSCEVGNLEVYSEQIGDNMDGIIEESQMITNISQATNLTFH